MRNIIKKSAIAAMIAGAALAVAACSKTENVNVVENTTTTIDNSMEPMEGSMTDNTSNMM